MANNYQKDFYHEVDHSRHSGHRSTMFWVTVIGLIIIVTAWYFLSRW